ncbi:uncharacterized protein LOC143285769 [Babylonia areolata]|uniref:uncharacterized protein LOC143285769 n=1 Tax=Babylonia areolata TaxID=304850 RepID=UPI003FD69BC3
MVLKRHLAFCIPFVILQTISFCFANVYELNKDSLEEFRKGKLLVVIFVDSPTCERCRIQFPYFVAASQAFPSDPEIFFVRVHDTRLVKEWGIAELPALMYYRSGIEEPDFFMVDVTVDDIIDEIARRLHGNFGGLDRFYAVDVTSQNFREVVKTPQQSVLLLTYDKKTTAEVKVMEQAAKIFRNDDAILICKLNVDKQKELRDSEFKSKDVPAVFWYKVGEKQIPKRFGGHISIYMQTTFINEQTGLNRNHDGSLKPISGRLSPYDSLIVENADGVLSGNKDDIGRLASRLMIEKTHLQRHQQEFADYYIFLLEKMRETGSQEIVETQMDDIARKLDEHEDMVQKQEDLLKRKRNILHFFTTLPEESWKFKEARRKKEEKERKRREEEERRKKMEEEEKKAGKGKLPHKKGARTEYTAKATLHRRVHEEL